MAKFERARQVVERTERLGELCDQVGELLGVDPERIMYDVTNNQVCVPAELMAQLLTKAGA